MDANEKRTFGEAIGGAAVAFAILDALHQKGVLSLAESRSVLESALKDVGRLKADGVYEAQGLIGNKLSGPFSAR